MNEARKAALKYAASLAKMDRENDAPEEETLNTTSIAIDAFIAGAKWATSERTESKLLCIKGKRLICNQCHECDVYVLNPNY